MHGQKNIKKYINYVHHISKRATNGSQFSVQSFSQKELFFTFLSLSAFFRTFKFPFSLLIKYYR